MTWNTCKALSGAVLAVLFLACGAAYADTLKPSHKVTAVEVFSDRAIVKRSADVKFDREGVYEVEISPLPPRLNEESVRVEAEGTAGVKIVGVEQKTTFLKKYSDEKIKALKKELDSFIKERNLIDAKFRNQEAAKKFLNEIKFKTHENMSRDVEKGKVSTVDWQGVLDFYIRGLNKADEEMSSLTVKRKEMDEKIRDIENELNSINGGDGEGQRSAVISFDVQRPGTLKVELSYMIFGVDWRPSYDARAMTAKNTVELTSYGNVRQSTGEDWKDVSLTLSTARPSLGAQVPGLYPWYLAAPARVDRRSKSISSNVGLFAEAPAMEAEVADGIVEEKAAPVTADISGGFTSTVFKIKKKADIASGGDAVRTTISVDKLDALFKYRTVPKLSQYVFLEAEVKNTAGYPLLPGNVNDFIDDKFVGSLYIGAVAPEEKLLLSLGVDEGIKVERKLVKHERGKSGVLSSKMRVSYVYKIEVTNFKKQDAEVTVLDQLPVSQDKDIVVEIDEMTPKPEEKGWQGTLKWVLQLKPGEKKEISFGFHVDYPENMPAPL